MIASPNSTKIERGEYSAIMYLDGDLCVAEDNEGNVISEQAKSDYVSNVIQAAADETEHGRIFVRNEGDEAYIIKSGVTLPTRTSFISDGAELDLTNLNSTFLTIGSDSVYSANLGPVEIAGFFVDGGIGNLNTKFLKATNISRTLNIHDINHRKVNNFIEVRGACYDARITNIHGARVKGTWIKFSSFDLESVNYEPHCGIVSHCEVTSDMVDAGSNIGVEILASPTGFPGGIVISDTSIELLNTCIYNEGQRTRIINCPYLEMYGNSGFGIKNVQSGALENSGNRVLISGCYISVTANGVGIYNNGDHLQVLGNHISGVNDAREAILFESSDSYAIISDNFVGMGANATYAAIKSINHMYLAINGNNFRNSRVTMTGKTSWSNLSGNLFWGTDSYTTLKDLESANMTIVGNVFYDGLNWLDSSLVTKALITNNKIASVVNKVPIVGTQCVIRHNVGYITEKSGNSTGTGAQQTVAHGLNGTPAFVMVGDTEQNANPYQSASADATSIYVTAGNGLDWWWKVEI